MSLSPAPTLLPADPDGLPWLGPDGPRVALVHDWLNQLGGAENVLEEMLRLFPGAPVYTSIYAADRMPAAYRDWTIHTTFMQHLPGVADHHQRYMPLYAPAFARFDLSSYDLVISNKSGFAHGARTTNGSRRALHICYCLTPTRFLWLYDQYRQREQIGGALDLALRPLLACLRRWDWQAAQLVDHFLAISTEVQERIQAIYGRPSQIVFPPVNTDYFTPDPLAPVGDFYLIVSRLIPYKRIDLAVEAFRRLPHEKLVVVGDGRDRAALQAAAGPNVTFLGRQSQGEVRRLMQRCKAFLFPGLEDFGIAPVEAMSTGRPVIAFAGGGSRDTVLPGRTGELFAAQTVDCLADTLRHFAAHAYDPAGCRAHAETFSAAAFRRNLAAAVARALG